MSSCSTPSPVPTPYPYESEPVFPKAIGAGPRGMPAHACMGLNSCRGSDRYGVAGPNGSPSSGGCGGSSSASGCGGKTSGGSMASSSNGCGGTASPPIHPNSPISSGGGAGAPSQPNGCGGPSGGGSQANGCGGPSGGGSQPNGCGGPSGGGTSKPRPANACAGQGYCSTATDHTCHVQNSCRDQGGCGLYGTAEELYQPGENDCRSQGSCATPINAERFSTNGRNQGKSVWLRARARFEERWPEIRAELLEKQARGELDPHQPLPETLGPPPAAFAATGPTYLWISSDNKARDNMTACGSSGMSGAGGCS